MFVQGQLNNAGANENMTALVEGLAVSAVRPTWTPPGPSGGGGGGTSWNTAANWDWHLAPNYRDADAIFSNAVTTPQLVTVDAPVTVGSITFDSAQPHTISSAGAGAITFDTYSGESRIEASAGAHTIAAPVTLLRPLNISVAGGAAITLSGDVTANGQVITKSGDGDAELPNVRTTALNVDAGVLRIASSGGAAGGVSNVGALAIAGAARLDLRDNKLVTSTPAGTFSGGVYSGVQGEVQRAYNFGAWDQPGLMTSTEHAGPNAGPLSGTTTIGVATGEQILFLAPTETGMFAGQMITGATTIAIYTYAGDMNFDGLVDAADYGVIDNWIQFPATDGYANGDLNYDGVIDASDYGIIDNTIQLQGPPIPVNGSAGVAGLVARASSAVAVPEPLSMWTLASAGACWATCRRHRRAR
jgi:hypothetical protein